MGPIRATILNVVYVCRAPLCCAVKSSRYVYTRGKIHIIIRSDWQQSQVGKLLDMQRSSSTLAVCHVVTHVTKLYGLPCYYFVWMDLTYNVLQHCKAMWKISRSLRSTPMNGTSPSLPWRSTHPRTNRGRRALTSINDPSCMLSILGCHREPNWLVLNRVKM